ncbi:MAG: hypothetical protein A2Y38_08980 [Spirochaetes bacterium GWB1_59_5]|nr:MAG: hypothetical protein A2Y38_08980 [Spirochaetes bacterium GWB1_59_5]
MKRVGYVILIIAVTTTLSSCGNEDKNFLELMFDIDARASKNAPPSSVEEIKGAIAKYGDEVEKTAVAMEKVGNYWRLLAVKYLEKGLYGDAYDAALKALRHYPEASGLYYVAGLSSAFLSKTASAEVGGGVQSRAAWLLAAENSYKRSLEIDPKNTKSLYGLAVLYSFELDNHEAALPHIEKYLSIDTKNVDAMFVKARALYGAGRLQESVDAYDLIIETTVIDEKKKMAADNKKVILDELYGK